MLKKLKSYVDSTIAIIPARGGSSRIKNKNLKKIGTDTLIRKSIKTCIDSRIFDQIIVTSDSKKIINESKDLTLVHKRSEINSKGTSSSESAVKEVIDDLPDLFENQVLIYLVQCTSPFLNPESLAESYKLIMSKSSKYNCLLSGYFFNKFIWENEKKSHSWLPINYDPQKRPRSQDKFPLFVENGAFYAFGSSNFKLTNCRIHGEVGVYAMEELRSIDIDEKDDLDYAIFLSEYLKS